jgi:hypothetical protein
MTEPRTIPPLEADERATLTAFLDRQRATLAPERPRFPAPVPLTAASRSS